MSRQIARPLALTFPFALLVSSASPIEQAGRGQDAVTAIEGVAVISMADPPFLANQTVVIVGNRIAAISSATDVTIPTEAVRIDGSGQFLIPGLADMHVHLEYFNHPDVLKLFLAKGVTTVRNMDGRDYLLDWRRRIERAELLGPRIYTAGPLLDGDPPIFPDNTVVSSPAQARELVRSQAEAGYDFVKVYVNLPADAYREILSTASDYGLPVVGHVPREISLEEAISGPQSTVEHLTDLGDWIEADDSPFLNGWHWSKLYLAMPIDTAKLATAARRIADSGTWTVPTMIQARRALAPDDTLSAWQGRQDVSHIPADGKSRWIDQIRGSTARMDDADWAIVARGAENRRRLVGALHSAGAPLLAGTDTPNPFVVPGFSLPDELQLFVAAGLTPTEALAIATREAARFFGDLDEWGTVEEGKQANLVLLQRNPLENIENVELISGVFLQGRWLPRTELEKALENLEVR